MNWLSRWFSRRPNATRVPRRQFVAQLEVEALEQRQVPTVTQLRRQPPAPR